MPTISPDGSTVTFQIMPHYFKDIQCGRKKADIRRLDQRWEAILNYADKVRFESTETEDCDTYRLDSIKALSTEDMDLIRQLYSDIRWDSNYGTFYLIRFFIGIL